MTARLPLAAIVLSTLLIAAAYGSAWLPGGTPPWGPWAMAMGTAVMMVAAMALGAQRAGRLGRLKVPFALVFLVLAGGFGYALWLPAPQAGDPLVFGLPRGAAVVLLGIGLVPLFLLPTAYAMTFDEMTLGEADLARVREEARRLREAALAGEAADAAAAPRAAAPAEVR